jgi:Cd2+/Zn2+-exporting ATPase
MRKLMTSNGAIRFHITGMDCAEEVAILKREVGPLVGGSDRLAFDILNGHMTVLASEPAVSSQAVIEAVRRTGMRAAVWDETENRTEEGTFWQRNGRTILSISSGLLLISAVMVHAAISKSVWVSLGLADDRGGTDVPLATKALFALSALAGLWVVLPKAWFALVRLRPDMNLLMTIAVLGATAIGEWFEAATVGFLFSVSLALESWSVSRARRAVAALMELTPPTARLQETQQEVPAESVAVGTVISVRPGERIPLDGRVVAGQSHVNQAPITGESVPVSKSVDEEVFAGTINGDGALQIRTTKAASETTLANIIRMVGEAQSRRAPSEQWVERFARYYTPLVMVLAVLVLVVPPLAFRSAWQDWFYNALVLLVIACPCALVISTPVSIVAALAAAARQGVLVKGGIFIEVPASLNAMAFDKTGTLTIGRPSVLEVVPLNGHSVEELLLRAASMELHSDHPLAQAIVHFAAEQGIKTSPAESFQILPGKGASALFDGRPFWLGSHRYLEERSQETPEVHVQIEQMSAAGRTVVVIGNDKHICGFITLADEVRPQCREILHRLRGQGIQHLIMLTGDNEATAREIAKITGMDEFRAELLPEDKVAAIESLVAKYGTVAMVGDGVNDAPALGRATMGIAMGAVGSDAALETADAALMSDDLAQLPWLVAHSRRALAIIRQNIWFSLGIKALFVVLTFVGWSSLWAAIAADMGASLLVVFNGLRLLRVRSI